MLRISQVWKICPKDFQAPDQLWIEGIKGQEGVWITLRPAAAAIVRELLPGRRPDQRLFDYWKTVDSMRGSVHDKAHRVGLPGVRFHDACKVTRVTELDAAGYGLGEIAAIANTTKRVLSDHYIKADRRRAFEKYQRFPDSGPVLSSGSGSSENSGQLQVSSGSEMGGNGAQKVAQAGQDSTISTEQNASSSPQISEL